MSTLDKIRQKHGQPPTGAIQAAKPTKAQPKPATAPTRVMCSCGHEDNNRPCGECRNAAHVAKVERNRLKREARKGSLPSADEGRLPDGAAFTVAYHAISKRWSGKLAIGGAVFEGKASGVFRLLQNLDAAYRASTSPPPATAPEASQADGGGCLPAA